MTFIERLLLKRTVWQGEEGTDAYNTMTAHPTKLHAPLDIQLPLPCRYPCITPGQKALPAPSTYMWLSTSQPSLGLGLEGHRLRAEQGSRDSVNGRALQQNLIKSDSWIDKTESCIL